MLHPNYATLAQLLHEERVAEALQNYRWRAAPRHNWLLQLPRTLVNRLLDLGRKFKTQLVATPPAEPAIG
jgi:uncharacterized Fe-S cluster-containing radical SAM superfamily protein